MSSKRCREEAIVRILREVEGGRTITPGPVGDSGGTRRGCRHPRRRICRIAMVFPRRLPNDETRSPVRGRRTG